ncbi:MAG TPA: hypothetical protein VL651_08990, partial [Bacteroidia bacterium]|nr:hypothetical protein [Bacteroidia bacterium]
LAIEEQIKNMILDHLRGTFKGSSFNDPQRTVQHQFFTNFWEMIFRILNPNEFAIFFIGNDCDRKQIKHVSISIGNWQLDIGH